MGYEGNSLALAGAMSAATAKRCARDAIQRALRTSDGRGVKIGSFLLGLWQVAIGTLLEAGEGEDVCALLVDRIGKIQGYGRNADAAPIQYDDLSLRRRVAEASYAADIIVQAIDEFAEGSVDEDGDDPMPEAILDAAIVLLSEAWGPVHLRKAMREQAEAVATGRTKPVMPAEPAVANNLGRERPFEIKSEKLASKDEPTYAPRSVEAVIETAAVRECMIWVVALTIRSSDGTRAEVREVIGTRQGLDVKAAHIEACLDLFRGLGSPREGDQARISTNSSFLVTEVTEGAPARSGMSAAEATSWHEIEEAARSWQVRWQVRQPATDGPLDQRCDKILRHKLADVSKAAN
ncbi:hypothetical protein BSY19_4938 (plasmid) [Bosea sp. RAC05]|nr:hypothetical protein BSY19_4938 [Bosea sp. RAC05]